MRLKRESPDPLYAQLKDLLRTEIETGHYRVNDRLPSERELADHYQVSRITVRQALLDMAREGTVYTRVGKGTFVAEPKIDQPLRAVTGFSQDVQMRGSRPASRVLEARVIPAAPDVAAALRIVPNVEVVLLSRLRLADDIPLAIETAYLPFSLCPTLLSHNFAVESLYNVLQNDLGYTLWQAEQTIEAGLATAHEIDLLAMTPPAAVLKMVRLTFIKDSVPIEYVFSIYRGDRYKFHSTLQPSVTGQPA
ncbi:HTH-type transcriptional repressor NagR [Thermoflexales bacterium]|nr:HTH-type transcriptional repressor NagR [Thermoflexales bacterium]